MSFKKEIIQNLKSLYLFENWMKTLRSKTELTSSKFTLTFYALLSSEQHSELSFWTFRSYDFVPFLWKIQEILLLLRWGFLTEKSYHFSQCRHPEHFVSPLSTPESPGSQECTQVVSVFEKTKIQILYYFFFNWH